jgi:type VI secretion system protein VasG
MAEIKRSILFGKLNPIAYKAIESATIFSKMRGNPYVELVHLLDEALEAAARLSHRYIPSQQLPVKAISLVDTACARVAISQHATPPALEDSKRRISALETELAIIGRESMIGIDHQQRTIGIEADLTSERERLETLEKAYKKEKELVGEILDLRRKLRLESARPIAGSGKTTLGDPGREPADSAERSEDEEDCQIVITG